MNSCKNNLFEFYSKKLMERKIFNKKYYGVVSCGVYFQHCKENEFKYHIPLSKFMKFNKYINVWGYDSDIVKDIKRWGENKKNLIF
ncbi:hypothetical protein F1B95_08650 [Clostridium perfringens]|nr:hypothetical protein F1B95_08650 [Clostridium perfringens]